MPFSKKALVILLNINTLNENSIAFTFFSDEKSGLGI